mgnify:FL=1
MEGRALKTKAFLAGAESAEVFRGLGDDVSTESHLNAAKRLAVGGHVEENNGVGHREGEG